MRIALESGSCRVLVDDTRLKVREVDQDSRLDALGASLCSAESDCVSYGIQAEAQDEVMMS